jgi:hypothetical protein
MSRTALTTAALAVIMSVSGAHAQAAQSLTDINELYWQTQFYLREAPAEANCLNTISPYAYLLVTSGKNSTTCHFPANKQVVIPVVATIRFGTMYVGYLPLYATTAVDGATNLSLSINGRREDVTADWRAPTPIFLASAIEGQLPSYVAADGYFTVRTFRPGTYTIHTTGCLPASADSPAGPAMPAACSDMTYRLIIK